LRRAEGGCILSRPACLTCLLMMHRECILQGLVRAPSPDRERNLGGGLN
jgi:hypothetical protein